MIDNPKAEAMTVPPAKNNLPLVVERNEFGQPLGQAPFWRLRHTEASPVLGQVPFLFWLTEVTSSRVIVQMGLNDGIAYLALCQAAERLNGSATCFALDAEDAALAPALQAEHDENYSDFSQIISGERAITSLPEGIDLLVIGAPLDRNSRDLLRDVILPRLSESAVLVLINPDAVLADQSARRILTNDNQLLLSLQPVVSGGVEIHAILYGAKQSDQLRRLAAQPGRSSWLAMRQAFNRLGQGIVAVRQNRDLLLHKEAWQDRLKQAEARIKALEAEVEKAEASVKIQHHLHAEMAAHVHDLQRAASQAEDARRSLQIERDALAGQMAELVLAKEQTEYNKEIAERDAAAQLAEMQRAVEHARTEHDVRIEDIVVLTATYEDTRQQAEKKFKTQLAEKNKRVTDLQRDLIKVSSHRDALLDSTSWKITSPMRKVTKFIRGR